MRWSIIRTIWFREMRDQLRDRRTLLMIFGLPLVLYPLLGFAFLQFAVGFMEKPCVVGVVTGAREVKDFPPRHPPFGGRRLEPFLAWLSATPMPGSDLGRWNGAYSLSRASNLFLDYPLFVDNGQLTTFDTQKPRAEARALSAKARVQFEFLAQMDHELLASRGVDLILEAPLGFYRQLDSSEMDAAATIPRIILHERSGDERSRLASRRMTQLLDNWKYDLKKVRLARRGIGEKYLEPFTLHSPDAAEASESDGGVFNLIARIFPFLLVMWSLAGALYPAVDLCAGEKERGTMETLLITPAGREEIVIGKFLTIWIFSAGTAILNLLSMGISTAMFSQFLPQRAIAPEALVWCVVLSLPQSAFFSALGLAIGAYARSSKEGQYYLMPLFVITMPFIFLTLAPGVELNALYSMVPVTGVALLMQRLMTATNLGEIPWAYFVPVLAPIGLYSWLALRWAIEQFNREEVLFREAERLDLMLWFKSLLRNKDPMPSSGEAFFCLGLIIGMRWLSLGFGDRWSLPMHTIISQIAFVATPPLFMVLLLNTQPASGLYARWPTGRDTAIAAVLAMLLLAPITGLTRAVGWTFPDVLQGTHPSIAILSALNARADAPEPDLLMYFLAFAFIPALCEEIAFRGIVLCGLHQAFRPRNAVLLSSFFYALFHLNVFLFVPAFVLGVILGLLTVRSRSLLPAIAFHLLHNSVLIALIPLRQDSEEFLPRIPFVAWVGLIAVCLITAASLVWWLYRKPYVDLARREAASMRG